MKSTTLTRMGLVAAMLLAIPAYAADMPEGDAEKGEKKFKACAACHAVGEGAKHKVGPHLNDLIGRTAGSLEDYKYSKGMAKMGEEGLVWTEEILFEYLEKPRTYVKGTKMSYAGLRKPQDRANVIAFLKKYSKPADADAEAQAPAEPAQ